MNEEKNVAIQEKLRAKQELTFDEVNYVIGVLEDPLQEFCNREGEFRLREILDVPEEEIPNVADSAAEVIRNNIDYNESLYDSLDYDLREMLDECNIKHN